ncbi:FMN-binding negative transcriptional regulator [Christiangramia portivictoriae]|uniref:FMN-binding negative transcriptional regulator n=1 Tax=Christiangramia portivictoriae TaxID=326069 RepID=UPI0003FE1B1F|nr:FMN-binding negative transcriptional regulator [Christiangramia portivictoriae]
MYRPKKYRKDDDQFILPFLRKHPFATFILKGEDLLATHIPVLIQQTEDGSWKLFSHIANHNRQKQFLKDDVEVLVIFHGAHSYISSSWYKEADISTWDYSAVHVNGKIKLQSDTELRASLDELVANFEKEQENPFYYNQIPKKMLEEHLPLITGFWIEPVKVEGIAKLHQSYHSEDVDRVIRKLDASEDPLRKQISEDIKKEHQL